MKEQILIVDADKHGVALLGQSLGALGYEVDVVAELEAALGKAEAHDYAVVIADEKAQGADGLASLDALRTVRPDATYVLASDKWGVDRMQTAINEYGIEYIVCKPYNVEEIHVLLNRSIEIHWEKALRRRMEKNAAKQGQAIQAQKTRLHDAIETAIGTLSEALLRALSQRGHETDAHVQRTAACTLLIADQLGIDNSTKVGYRLGALLHDVGKITIPDSILLKEGPLNDVEWALVKMHPHIGAELLAGFKELAPARRVVAQHHENWDGSGYPHGLSGEQIDLGARIFAVADALDAMISPRPYRPTCDINTAREEIQKCSGTKFDPQCVKAFMKIPEQAIREIYARYVEP